MEHGSSFLQSGVVFLIAAVFMVPLAKRLQLGAVLGYLLAGVLIGPSVLGLVDNPESVAQISEMGVVLLLFIIGLELSPRRLWVIASQDQHGVTLTLRDNGPGFSEDALAHAHEPFFTTKTTGTGLGLAVVKAVARAHQGQLQLRSRPGRGTCATLILPLIPAAPLSAIQE